MCYNRPTYSPITGLPMAIDGWDTFEMGIDSLQSPPDASTNIETLTGGLLTDGPDGQIYFNVPDTIPAGSFYFDAQASDENGEIYTFAVGKIIFKQDKTK